MGRFLIVMVLVAAACVTGCVCGSTTGEPVLSDYPALFLNNTIIVTGTNASLLEDETAEDIAEYLLQTTRNTSSIKTDAEVTELEKASYNLILIGVTDSNSMLNEVYELNLSTRVTGEYPGTNKSIVEIMPNPWEPEKALLIIAGSDELGVKAGGEILKYVNGASAFDKKITIMDWEYMPDVENAIALGVTPDEYSAVDKAANDYFSEHYPGVSTHIIYTRVPEMEGKEGLKVLKAKATFMSPRPYAIFGLYQGNVSVISGGIQSF
jgi:hypothetical protein